VCGRKNLATQNLKITLEGFGHQGRKRESDPLEREKNMIFITITLGFILIISTLMDG